MSYWTCFPSFYFFFFLFFSLLNRKNTCAFPYVPLLIPLFIIPLFFFIPILFLSWALLQTSDQRLRSGLQSTKLLRHLPHRLSFLSASFPSKRKKTVILKDLIILSISLCRNSIMSSDKAKETASNTMAAIRKKMMNLRESKVSTRPRVPVMPDR